LCTPGVFFVDEAGTEGFAVDGHDDQREQD